MQLSYPSSLPYANAVFNSLFIILLLLRKKTYSFVLSSLFSKNPRSSNQQLPMPPPRLGGVVIYLFIFILFEWHVANLSVLIGQCLGAPFIFFLPCSYSHLNIYIYIKCNYLTACSKRIRCFCGKKVIMSCIYIQLIL